MRRIRNPRYAPEFLERKLSPSDLVTPPVDVSTTDPSDTALDPGMGDDTNPNNSTDPAAADPAPGDPPPDDPTPPADPAGPGYVSVDYATA